MLSVHENFRSKKLNTKASCKGQSSVNHRINHMINTSTFRYGATTLRMYSLQSDFLWRV
jgi:hypothetical protein